MDTKNPQVQTWRKCPIHVCSTQYLLSSSIILLSFPSTFLFISMIRSSFCTVLVFSTSARLCEKTTNTNTTVIPPAQQQPEKRTSLLTDLRHGVIISFAREKVKAVYLFSRASIFLSFSFTTCSSFFVSPFDSSNLNKDKIETRIFKHPLILANLISDFSGLNSLLDLIKNECWNHSTKIIG